MNCVSIQKSKLAFYIFMQRKLLFRLVFENRNSWMVFALRYAIQDFTFLCLGSFFSGLQLWLLCRIAIAKQNYHREKLPIQKFAILKRSYLCKCNSEKKLPIQKFAILKRSYRCTRISKWKWPPLESLQISNLYA